MFKFLTVNQERAEGIFSDFERTFCRYLFAKKFIEKQERVLDIASGSGLGTNYLSKQNVKEMHGLEIDPKAIEFARKEFARENIIFHKKDVINTGFEENFFDAIVTFETIEHIADHEKFIKEIKRILKPGGLCILSTPNKKIFSPGIEKPLNNYHIKEWEIDELKKFLQKYFEITDIYVQKFSWSKKIIILRNLYVKFFSLFGNNVARTFLKLLHSVVFTVAKKGKAKKIDISLNSLLELNEEDYGNSVYYPQKYNPSDDLFGIQLFILRNNKKV